MPTWRRERREVRVFAGRFAAAAVFLTGCVDPPAPVSLLVPNEPSLIINGTPTGSTFGAVGVVAFDFDRDGNIEGTEFICSGSLIAPTVFLTAAYCLSFVPPTAQLGVTFASNLLAPGITMIAAQAFHLIRGSATTPPSPATSAS